MFCDLYLYSLIYVCHNTVYTFYTDWMCIVQKSSLESKTEQDVNPATSAKQITRKTQYRHGHPVCRLKILFASQTGNAEVRTNCSFNVHAKLYSYEQELPAKLSMGRPRMLVTPGDWKYIYIDMYCQSPGVTSTDVFLLCRQFDWYPKFGKVRSDRSESNLLFLGLTDDLKIVLIDWSGGHRSQVFRTDGRTDNWYSIRTNRGRLSQKLVTFWLCFV